MQSSHQDTPEQPAITGHIPTPDPDLYSDLGLVIPLASVAALDSSAWSGLNPTSAIPVNWEDRARRAWEFYVEEPLVKNCVNSWRTFAVGDEIQITADDEQVRNETAGLAGRLDLCKFVKDMILQLLVKGDAVGFKRYTKDGNDIEDITCVNPISVKVTYAHGQLMEAKQYPDDGAGAGDGLSLPVEQVLHLKWDAPEFSPRGNSLVLPAFQSIDLLRDYRKAEQAIAKRWTTPFRMLKVGGAYGAKVIMPDQKMLETVRDMVNKMDLKSGLVVPFYVNCETHGTDGQIPDIENKVREVKEDIMIALGLSRSLVSGDGPNFATASISLQKMFIMIREIKHAARTILDWILSDWLEMKRYSGTKLHYIFNDLDPSDATDFKKLLIELYDRKLISRSTMLMKMDLDPAIETAKQQSERGAVDMLDEKQVKPIVEMLMAGIIGVETAQEMFGLDPKQNPSHGTRAEAAWMGLFTQADYKDDICDSCGFFDEETNKCGVTESETTFDTAACRFLRPKGGSKPGV